MGKINTHNGVPTYMLVRAPKDRVYASLVVDLDLSIEDITKLVEHMRSWKNIHALFQKIPESEKGMYMLKKMILFELNRFEGPRLHIMSRLHMRLNTIRYRVEEKELMRLCVRP